MPSHVLGFFPAIYVFFYLRDHVVSLNLICNIPLLHTYDKLVYGLFYYISKGL